MEMKALVLFSGGIDSTTALGLAIKKYGKDQVIALSISYGQKHTKEIEASDKIAKYYNVRLIECLTGFRRPCETARPCAAACRAAGWPGA